jgi:uncharacterized membrane protein
MIKSVKVATLVTAMLFSAGAMAQMNSEVVTKPAPSSESKAPVGASSKSRAEVKSEAKTGSAEVLKPGQSGESRSAAPNSSSGKSRADAKHESKMEMKKGTTADGMNEPDSAYQKTPDPKAKMAPTKDKY